MATQIKKGTEVWYIDAWNSRATVYVKRLTITSWGKHQGTAVGTENGKPIKMQLYTDSSRGFHHLDNIIPVADMPDPSDEAMRRAIEQKRRNIQYYVDIAHSYSLSPEREGDERYLMAIRQSCETIMAEEPAVVYR